MINKETGFSQGTIDFGKVHYPTPERLRLEPLPGHIRSNQGFATPQHRLAGCGKTYLFMKSLSAPCGKNWLLSYCSLPLAGETTEGEAGCEDFFSSLLAQIEKRL
jgi:hypothetical protein